MSERIQKHSASSSRILVLVRVRLPINLFVFHFPSNQFFSIILTNADRALSSQYLDEPTDLGLPLIGVPRPMTVYVSLISIAVFIVCNLCTYFEIYQLNSGWQLIIEINSLAGRHDVYPINVRWRYTR